ncbi:MAG TPA: tetratricopeptide repeat protein [Hyphomicrobiales bacterium]|nr:tetratricopeptide repeat protein [Hyphomicrobiales bacterium]
MQRAAPFSCLALAASLAALACSPALMAREQLYGALDDSALLDCENQYWSGQVNAAQGCYRALVGTAASTAIRAEALWALGDLQGANGEFQAAQMEAPDDARVRLRWGELYLQTYQYQEAYNLFTEALERDPRNAYAHIGAAEALSQGGNAEEVNQHLGMVMDDALAPPGARLRGLLMLARSVLERDQFDTARDYLDEADKLARDRNLSRLEPLALRAGLAFMTHQPYQQYIDEALGLNPAYGDAWAIPGYFAMITRRYAECGEFYQKAVAIEPTNWEAHLELGQNYLRLNQVGPSREHIDIAYSGDPFNPKTINLLRLLDTFVRDLEAVSYPDPPQGAFPKLTLRLDRRETDVLADYARELAEASIDLYSERYRFTPKQPIVVEIYPNHEDFVVRSIGMPGVGILGVTFGYLFSMDSPTAQHDPSYHWGTTLWHEMAHVFTLEASHHLVPRWFSEGISVFEEWRTGPTPGRKIPLTVLKAMGEGKFLPIAKLDDGFMRPSYPEQVIVSYMQAGLVFDFIDTEYGFDKVVDMLYRFQDGENAVTAIETVLGISADEFDNHFKQFIDIEYGPMLSRLPTWQQDHKASFAALEEENWEEAIAAAERANFAYPDYVEIDSPYIAMARAYARLDDTDKEFETLREFHDRGGYAPRALLALGDRYLERNDQDGALRAWRDVLWVSPFMEELHVKLGDLYMTQSQPDKALKEYQVLLALDPTDKASANLKLAQAYHALGDTDRTMEHLLTALDIAPQFREAQRLLLELSRDSTQ